MERKVEIGGRERAGDEEYYKHSLGHAHEKFNQTWQITASYKDKHIAVWEDGILYVSWLFMFFSLTWHNFTLCGLWVMKQSQTASHLALIPSVFCVEW